MRKHAQGSMARTQLRPTWNKDSIKVADISRFQVYNPEDLGKIGFLCRADQKLGKDNLMLTNVNSFWHESKRDVISGLLHKKLKQGVVTKITLT